MGAVSFSQHLANSYKIDSTRNEKLGYFGGTLASFVFSGTLASFSIITFKAALIGGVLASAIAIIGYKILLSYQAENDYQQGIKHSHLFNGLPLLEKAAHRGHREAQFSAGKACLLLGKTLDAIDYFKQLAGQGHLEALFMLGDCHSEYATDYHAKWGLPTEERDKLAEHGDAIRYFKQAADGGHLEALFRLGVEYKRRYKEKDIVNALECYQKAADRGHLEAQFSLAQSYRHGWGVEKNNQKAFENYLKVANREDVLSTEQLRCRESALTYVINAYKEGEGVKQNLDLATHYSKLLFK